MFMYIPLRSSGSAVTHFFVINNELMNNDYWNNALLEIKKCLVLLYMTYLERIISKKTLVTLSKYSMTLSNKVKNFEIFLVPRLPEILTVSASTLNI